MKEILGRSELRGPSPAAELEVGQAIAQRLGGALLAGPAFHMTDAEVTNLATRGERAFDALRRQVDPQEFTKNIALLRGELEHMSDAS
jgi:hypothetical protein